MTATEISSMTVQERLQAMEALWDSLNHDEIDVPDWHKDILAERAEKIRRGEAEFVSLDALKKKYRK